LNLKPLKLMNTPLRPCITLFLCLAGLWNLTASEDPDSQPVSRAPVVGNTQEEPAAPVGGNIPAAVTEEDYSMLASNSPFTRSLNLSDSLILTGIAKIGDETMATLVDKESKETYIVSANANAQGWRMVDVEGDRNNLEAVTAKIAVSGGEVISVRFDENQLKPEDSRPAGARGDGRGDGDRGGDRRGPPPEMREKMSKLSDEQRGKLFEHMRQLREKNPDMSRDDMREAFSKSLDRLVNQKR